MTVTNLADDAIGTFDPLLTNVNSKGAHPHYRGGYKIWPSGEEVERAKLRLMCIGNSTSLWPASAWSLELGKSLRRKGHAVAIYNGAGKGHSSSQELLRVVRDAPAIKPDAIISLSGICDIGYLVNAKGYPFLHKYARRISNYVLETGAVRDINNGYPDPALPSEIWCRNQRLAHVLATEMGIKHVTILQPVQGYGPYPQSEEEKEFFAQKAKVILKSADLPYSECVKEFYDGVYRIMKAAPEKFAHVVDFVDVFADTPGAYRDHRHQSELGVQHLAKRIEEVVMPLILK